MLAEAFAIDGPAIVDAVVVSNELPNLPHLDLDMIGHFALAKIKEAVLAVTGRSNLLRLDVSIIKQTAHRPVSIMLEAVLPSGIIMSDPCKSHWHQRGSGPHKVRAKIAKNYPTRDLAFPRIASTFSRFMA